MWAVLIGAQLKVGGAGLEAEASLGDPPGLVEHHTLLCLAACGLGKRSCILCSYLPGAGLSPVQSRAPETQQGSV